MTPAAIACAAAAVLLLTSPSSARTRLARVLPARVPRPHERGHPASPATGHTARPDVVDEPPGNRLSSRRARVIATALAAAGGALVVGGLLGMVVGAAVAAGTWTALKRVEPASRLVERERMRAMLPLAADLLTAAVVAGCAPTDAVEQVGRCLGGPLGRSFTDSAAAARVGSDTTRTWATLTDDPVLRPLGRALVAAVLRGSSPVPALERVAEDARASARWAAESRARSLGARAAAPLGLCFLPAFVLVGVVPVVAGSGLLP